MNSARDLKNFHDTIKLSVMPRACLCLDLDIATVDYRP